MDSARSLHWRIRMKNSFWTWLHHQGRCCSHCGSFQANDSQFCAACEADLWRRHPITRQFDIANTDIQAWALFDWFPDQDRKVSKLMISLKGGQLESAFQFYAKAFVIRRSLSDLPSNAVLVPCPGRPGRRHSEMWAQSVSKLLGLPVMEALEPEEENGTQKGKSRSERQRIRYRRKSVLRHKYVIFIDDIVTTGATAVAAQKALGPTEGFEVWCLAHRRQLAADLLF